MGLFQNTIKAKKVHPVAITPSLLINKTDSFGVLVVYQKRLAQDVFHSADRKSLEWLLYKCHFLVVINSSYRFHSCHDKLVRDCYNLLVLSQRREIWHNYRLAIKRQILNCLIIKGICINYPIYIKIITFYWYSTSALPDHIAPTIWRSCVETIKNSRI